MHDADMEIQCTKHVVIVNIDSASPLYFAPDVTFAEVAKAVRIKVEYMRRAQRIYMESRGVYFRNH
jgi:hypothetical protein